MSRDDCDNLPSEEFPSNVDTLVKLFVFVFHLLQSYYSIQTTVLIG